MLLFPIVYGSFPRWRKQKTDLPSIESPPKFSTSSKTTNDADIRLTPDTEDQVKDKDCFTEVAEECEDVCDVCRDVWPRDVKEVGLFFSVFHKSITRQIESCKDFNTIKNR